jgi:hypothetical protein
VEGDDGRFRPTADTLQENNEHRLTTAVELAKQAVILRQVEMQERATNAQEARTQRVFELDIARTYKDTPVPTPGAGTAGYN